MGLRRLAVLAAIPLLSAAAHAGVSQDLIAAINNCAAITDDATRHACYDRLPTLVKTLAPVEAAEAAPSPAAEPKAPAANAASEEKGFFVGTANPFEVDRAPVDRMIATVESYTYDYGVFIVTLDNGQVWSAVTATKDLLPLSKDKKIRIAIWRNAFGYDVLNFEGRYPTYHVRRIK